MPLMQEVSVAPSYDYLRSRLVAEAEVGTSALSIFKNIIPASIELISSNFTALANFVSGERADLKGVKSSDRRALIRALEKFDYIAYEETLIVVPEGFEGKLIPYLQVLLSQSTSIQKDIEATLSQFTTELGVFLSNKDAQIALSGVVDAYKKARTQREAYTKATKAFYGAKNQARSRVRLRDAIDRSRDLVQIFELEAKIKRARDQISYKAIQAEADKAVKMLGLVRERLDRGDIENVSPMVAKKLSEGAYEVASYLEYMGVYSYYLETALGSIQATSDILAQLMSLKQ